MLAGLLRKLLLIQVSAALLLGAALDWLTPWSQLSAWLIGALLVPLLPALSMGRAFLAAWRHQGEHAEPTSAADWISTAGREIVWTWRLFLWRQAIAPALPAQGLAEAPAPGAQARLPVLLIHGFVCNHRIFDAISERLRALGHPVRRLDLEPVFCSIDDYAPRIDAAVAAMLESSPHGRIAVIGHSMGGLATRAWLRAYPQRLAALSVAITLGTPHRGTRLEGKARHPNARQMRYHSEWLDALAGAEPAPLRERFSVCITRQDEIVFPQTEQWLPGMKVHTVNALGHLEMCADPGVIAWATDELSERSRTVPAPG